MAKLFENTKFSQATLQIFKKINDNLQGINEPVKAFIAGGVAVHLWTASRVSMDVDAIFLQRIAVPQDLIVFYHDEEMNRKAVQFDYTYSPTFGLLHPDYKNRAIRLRNSNCQNIDLHVLDPYDLVITKLVRFDERDKEDIQKLIGNNLVQDSDWLECLVDESLDYLVGSKTFIKYNLDEALRWIDNNVQPGPR